MDSRKRAIIAFIILAYKSKHVAGIYESTKSDYFKFVRIGPTDTTEILILDADSISRIHGHMPLFFDGLTNSYLKITRRGEGRYVCYDSFSNTYAAVSNNLDTVAVYDMHLRRSFVYSPQIDKDELQSMNDKTFTKSREYV